MTETTPQPIGARARHTYYWQVRNARTRALQKQNPAETWHIQAGHPGGSYSDLGHDLTPPGHHTPTLLTRSRPGSQADDEFRGGCLRCDWEGPTHRGERWSKADNTAIEDAHDHAFPGWRTLPPITRVKERQEVPRNRRLWHQATSLYPAGWVEQGAPRLAWSRYRHEAHVPPHRGRPRYELRIDRPRSHRGKHPADQQALF
ncbi:DUF6349 family protein [Streptomyces sp. NPDC127068]|uniref:DUF6349 family protein n=1 Tax=Streptomyces sp. NPDC127068 TaxID=3347127 RepID=UPI00365E94C9